MNGGMKMVWYLVFFVIRWATSKFLRWYNGCRSSLRRSFTWSVRHLCQFFWHCNWWTDIDSLLSTCDTVWEIRHNSNAFFSSAVNIMWSGSIHDQQIYWFAFAYLLTLVTANVYTVSLLERLTKDEIKTACNSLFEFSASLVSPLSLPSSSSLEN